MSSALDNDVFLRLPGQWETELWAQAALGSGGIYYNVYRWYSPRTGSYDSPDPSGLEADLHLYRFGANNPLALIDPLGLQLVVPPSAPPREPPMIISPDCSVSALRFITFIYQDRGIVSIWRLSHSAAFRLPRIGPGPRGTGGATLGCVCFYRLEGVYRLYDRFSKWEQTITCPPCDVRTRTIFQREGKPAKVPQDYITTRDKRFTFAPANKDGCLCPATLTK